ncbi:MAG: histidine phosphatase family protein [Desertimonas sp.]
MQLVLVRHGLPIRVEGAEGPADPPLSADGRRQAELLADYLAAERIDAVYTSPMRRAVETARPLLDRLGVEPIVDDDVAEWDRDSNEYVPLEELKAAGDPRYLELVSGRFETEAAFVEFRARVLVALDRIVSTHPGDTVAVVCHGGVINVAVAAVLGLSTGQFFVPNYTSISRVAASRAGVRSVISLNESAHLRHSGLPVGLFPTG